MALRALQGLCLSNLGIPFGTTSSFRVDLVDAVQVIPRYALARVLKVEALKISPCRNVAAGRC